MHRFVVLLVVLLASAPAGYNLWQLTADTILTPEPPAGEHPDLGIEMDPDGVVVTSGGAPARGLEAIPGH